MTAIQRKQMSQCAVAINLKNKLLDIFGRGKEFKSLLFYVK